jgi:glycine cleavage system H protein
MATMTTGAVPTDRLYTDIDSWLGLAPRDRPGDEALRVGVTDTVTEGTCVVCVELPRIDTMIEAGEPCALIWTVPLSLTAVYAPISGRVTAVNTAVRDDPGLAARDPFHGGWLFAVSPTAGSSTAGLLTASEYEDHVKR